MVILHLRVDTLRFGVTGSVRILAALVDVWKKAINLRFVYLIFEPQSRRKLTLNIEVDATVY